MLGPIFKGLLVFAAVGRLSKIVRSLDLLREEKEKDERKVLDEYLENHRSLSQNPSPNAHGGLEIEEQRGVVQIRRRSSLEKRKLNGLFETSSETMVDHYSRPSSARTRASDTVATAPGTTVAYNDESDQDRSSPEQARSGIIPKKIDAYHRKQQAGLSLSPSSKKKLRRQGAKRPKLKHGRRKSFERGNTLEDRYLAANEEYEGEGAASAPFMLERESRESSPSYPRQNSPEVVKIKVDLIESLKGNLENLKLNLRDSLELEGNGEGKDHAKDQDASSELSFSMLGKGREEEEEDNYLASHHTKPPVYRRRERGERDPSHWEGGEMAAASSRTYPEHSHSEYDNNKCHHHHHHHTENGIRPPESAARAAQNRRTSSSAAAGGAYNTSRTSTYTIPDSASDFDDSSGPLQPMDEGIDSQKAVEGTSPPAYFVHEGKVLPVGEAPFRKKKQKLLNVSQDSPEWFQSRYKNKEKDSSAGESDFSDAAMGQHHLKYGGGERSDYQGVAGGDNADQQGASSSSSSKKKKKKKSESPNEFFSKGGKQKVECRYVTQVSDCSPDWFQSKYSNRRYHPAARPDQAKDKEANTSIRKLNFAERTPL